MALTGDGGTLLAATSLSPEDGRGCILVIRTDSEGRELWSHSLDDPGSSRGADLRLVGEDGWMVLGTHRPEPSAPGDLLLTRGSLGPPS